MQACWCNVTSSRPSSCSTACGLSSSRARYVQSAYWMKGMATNPGVVLAITHNLFLLRPAQSRPSLPHILPPALCATPRGIVRSLHGALCMAPHIRFYPPPLHCTHVFHGLPRLRPLKHPHLHLEQEEPRYHAQLPRSARVQGAVPSLGVVGIFPHHAWHCA